MINLLSPVGDFECLKAAVQNGADSVYFGANSFSARAFATNFNLEELKHAIHYAKIRGVKTNLTLNTLIKNDEFDEAFNLAKTAYKYGIDAIIVQDLGLAIKLIKSFSDLPIHASTQMTVYNLSGALELQKLGFKRIILSRELSANEIEYICKNTNVEIECFIHGALCISYSGQCLFSSMLGGRSGNRGKCAGPCRLPFSLLENDKKIDSGYLLSTRDLCGLNYIPQLIEAGVKCLKIEGRMKTPEYVATVTRIYKKYIDLANSNSKYIIDEQDKKDLMQVFNRGMSSSGHLEDKPNRNLIFKESPGNMGLFLGIVEKFNSKKGLISLKCKEPIELGDSISLQKESGTYTISELMQNNKNIHVATANQNITIGRMKGNINIGDKIYKIFSKKITRLSKESYEKESKKILLDCKVTIKKDSPISISIYSANSLEIYKGLNINCIIDFYPIEAINRPLDKETIIKQLSKTSSTPFQFKKISIDLDDNIFLPKLSILNELRRIGLEEVEKHIIKSNERISNIDVLPLENTISNDNKLRNTKATLSVLLNILNSNLNYSKLESFDNIYIPLKYFLSNKYIEIIKCLSEKFDIFIYMPTIINGNYSNLFYNNIQNCISKYNIKGFVVSNMCNLKMLDDLLDESNNQFEIIANYTFNVFNSYSISELKNLNISRFTISPELDKLYVNQLCANKYLNSELIVYGKTPLLNINYCLLGETDKCYPECEQKCNISNNIYYLQDRLNMKFRILPDNIQTVTTIFNSKTTSIIPKNFNTDFYRIDILDENIDEINNIINTVNSNSRFEGKNFTNGNLNRII